MNCKKVEMVLDSKCFCGDKFIINPDVEIQVDLTELTALVGLFTHFKKLTLNENNIGKDTEVWAQGLAEKTVVNITSKVELKLESITIPGSVA
ncbi:hypothetical protein [Mariniphaga anaerophila]|nr:hypothetical protein [Mariniphaga anaerophila]